MNVTHVILIYTMIVSRIVLELGVEMHMTIIAVFVMMTHQMIVCRIVMAIGVELLF